MNVMLEVHLYQPQSSVVISVPLPHQYPALELNLKATPPCCRTADSKTLHYRTSEFHFKIQFYFVRLCTLSPKVIWQPISFLLKEYAVSDIGFIADNIELDALQER